MTTLNYSNVTPAEIASLTKGLQDNGGTITVTAAQPGAPAKEQDWTIGGHGITATAIYEPTTQELMVRILKKPILCPVALIDTKIHLALGRD